jgi:probable HAF family extracellular repeat protein
MMSFKSVFLRWVFAASLFVPAFCAMPTYTAVNVGSLGSDNSHVFGINDSGQVVGYSFAGPGSLLVHAFLYSGGVMHDLGTLGGSTSQATGINASGQVVGYSTTGTGLTHAFLSNGGVMTDLSTLGGSFSQALGINDSGQVVGYPTGLNHAFLYSGGVMTDLGTLGGSFSQASAINDSGQVVGGSATGTGLIHAFLYSGGVMTDLGTLGGSFSEAFGINDSGQVVGWSSLAGDPPNQNHAFLYSGGVMTDLGTLGGTKASRANGINDSGQVVGSSFTPTDGQVLALAFLYSGGRMLDLNNLVAPIPGNFLTLAMAVNSSGQIIADSYLGEAYLITPIVPLTITSPTSLSPGTVGIPYGPVPFVATGGAGGNHWSVAGLPNGLGVDPITGLFSGTPGPGTQGVYPNAKYMVTDSNGKTASVTMSLTINLAPPPPPVITSVSPNSVLGTNANQTFFINGNGFIAGPALIKVNLVWPNGQILLQGGTVAFLSSTQLSVTFNFSVGSGNWTAQVFNGDGQLSNTFFFSVAAPGSGSATHFAVPQFTFGGAWYSAIYLSNTTSAAVTVQVTFTDDNGAPLPVPLVGIGSVTSQTVNLPAGGTVVLAALNRGGANTEGWADVALPPGVIGYVVFRQIVGGRADQEALVQPSPESSQTADFTYDDTLPVTAVAFLNPSNQSVTITIAAYGPDGAQVGTTQVVLGAGAKSTKNLRAYAGMAGIVGKQGRVVVSVGNGAVSVLVLRFDSAAFTNVPVNYR